MNKPDIEALKKAVQDTKTRRSKEEQEHLERLRRLDEEIRKQDTSTRIHKAIASGYKRAYFTGITKAIAETNNPLQARLKLAIVPLDVSNHNKQGIKRSEKGNILSTALKQPIRASFDGERLGGHSGSVDIGFIDTVYEKDNIIYAESILWKERNAELFDYITEKGTVQNSWEIFYGKSTFDDNTEWLEQCLFAAATLVENPAYKGLTPVHLV